MPRRVAQKLMSGLIPGLLLWAIGAAPSFASPVGSRTSGIVPEARQQIRIMASVRPTLQVRQQIKSRDGTRAFCVWSNGPMPKYDVNLELQRGLAISRPQVTVTNGRIECSRTNSTASLVRTLETTNDNTQIPSVLTLIISPH
jgi:hypothetical protein